jgi:hypothetical protein
MWEPHLVVRGCCVWHASVERVFWVGFGGVGGASPHVWVPQCVAGCVCGVDLSDTLPYCSPYCGALPCTSRVFGPFASSSLSLTPSPHPIPSPWLCPACSGTSPALHKCRDPQPTPTPTHTLSSLRPVTHLMCCFIPCWCVCTQTVLVSVSFLPCCVSTLVCCPSHLATPLCGSSVCCSLCKDECSPMRSYRCVLRG